MKSSLYAGFNLAFAILRPPTATLTAATFIVSAVQAVRMARADVLYGENSPDSVSKAVRMDPGNAAIHAALAEQQQRSGERPDTQLQEASRLSPFDAKYISQLGFVAEVHQDYKAAERALLRAAKVDSGFRPRWALMNYYFRSNNSPEFWRWTRSALQRSYGDLTPLFRLSWAATPQSEMIEDVLPDEPEFRLRYLDFLNAEQPATAANRMARRVASELRPGDDPEAPLFFCNRIVERDSASALAVWNILCQRKAIPYEPLNPAIGPVVTNGDFASPLSGRGFDWRIHTHDGVRATSGPGVGLALAIDGSQPEIFDVIEQPVPLARLKRYRLNIRYVIAPQDQDSGLRWHLDTNNSSVLAETETLSGKGNGEQSVAFESGGADMAWLRLTYRRPRGSVRWSGTATILAVTIEPLP